MERDGRIPIFDLSVPRNRTGNIPCRRRLVAQKQRGGAVDNENTHALRFPILPCGIAILLLHVFAPDPNRYCSVGLVSMVCDCLLDNRWIAGWPVDSAKMDTCSSNQFMNKGFLTALGILLTFAGISLGANLATKALEARTVHYTAKQGTLRLEGRSRIHDWMVQGKEINGFIEVPSEFPDQPVQPAGLYEEKAIAEISVPVRSLKSVDKDGMPYSEKFDEIMYEKLEERTQPMVQFRLQKLVWTSVQTNSHLFKSIGHLVVGGRTNTMEFPVTIAKMPGTQLRIRGEVPINPTDFGILPPVIMDPPINRMSVKVSFDWTVERAK